MDFSFLGVYYNYFLSGTVVTLIISLLTVLMGTILGIFLALMKLSASRILRGIAKTYIEVFRGTPMLIQIIISVGLLHNLFTFPSLPIGILDIDLGRLSAGIVALSLNSAAYVAEIIRGGINAVDVGQNEAARSLGLSAGQTMRHIILPQALRNILPPLGNEFIVLIKDSSLLSAIGIYELMNSAQIVVTSSFIPMKPLYVAAVIYFILTFTTSQLLKIWERKLGVGYRR